LISAGLGAFSGCAADCGDQAGDVDVGEAGDGVAKVDGAPAARQKDDGG
jgi:hypothetical protein